MTQRHIVATRKGDRELRDLASGMASAYASVDPSAIPPPGMGGNNRAGVYVSAHSLLMVDIVHNALRVISNNIISMGDLLAYTKGFDIKSGYQYREYLQDQPDILTNTFGGGGLGGIGGTMMQCTGRDRTVWSMALFGEAFWYILRDSELLRPLAIEVLHPAFMDVKVKDGAVTYTYGSGSNKRILENDNVIQIPMKSLPGSRRALSPVDYASVAGALAMAAYEFGSSWFSQGAAPGFILSTDQKLGTVEVERIANKFVVEHSGLQAAHLPVVLDSGIKATKIMASPDESQYLNPLALDEPILTGAGWKTMGTVETGDTVYAEDGSATTVQGVSPVFLDSPCYELEFYDGTKIVASDDHRWHVYDTRDHQDKRGYVGEWKTLLTKDLAGTWEWHQGKNRYRVACDGVVDTPDADLPIDPYLFGYWLGDGSSEDSSVTVGDDDRQHVIDAITAAGCRVTTQHELSGGWGHSWRVRFVKPVGNLRADLRDLGVFGVGNKHIPDCYMMASPVQRKALLAGLLDSDGSAGPRVRFTSTLPRLAADVLTLARSLGQRASTTTRECPPREGVKTSRPQTIVSWTATFDPFHMARKSATVRVWAAGYRQNKMGMMSLVGMRRVKSRSTRCISIVHESKVFLVGRTFVPTGNTLEYNRQVLGSWFGLPPSKMPNALQRQPAAPPHVRQEEQMAFQQDTLSGYTVPLEEVHSALIPTKQFAGFDEDRLSKPDAQFLAMQVQAYRQSQVASINDGRVRLLGWAPVAGGDDVLAPLASNTAPSQTQDQASQSSDDEREAILWLVKRMREDREAVLA